jgi:hypothetical protein
MIPIPVVLTEYTATRKGHALKVVSCENCSTEYVYSLEREASGVGTSVYMLNNKGAAGHAQSAAGDTLKEVLDNDFDPVPCPACGHYQRYMFPKLRETKGIGVVVITIVLLMIGIIAAIGALKCSLDYLLYPSEADFRSTITAYSVLLVVSFIGIGLSILNKRQIRRFDPNVTDQQARIAIGRSRAVTRAEFEKMQQEVQRG